MGHRDTWSDDDWRFAFDERVGIKMDSGIPEKEAECQAREEIAPMYRKWKHGRPPENTGRGRAPRK